jgi:hypothetical protein
MLSQSYMPAQELQILQNPSSKELSPWYALPRMDIHYGSVEEVLSLAGYSRI